MKKKYKLKAKYKNMLDIIICYFLIGGVILLALYTAPIKNERLKKQDQSRHIKIKEIRDLQVKN